MVDKFAYISSDRGPTRKTKLRQSSVRKNASKEDRDEYLNGLYREPKKVDVPVSKLRATQDEVVKSIVADYTEDPQDHPVRGIRDPDSGKVHLIDGHHRAEAAKARGDKYIKAEVQDHKGIDKT